MSLDSAIQYLTSAMEDPSSARSACHKRMCTAGERIEEAFNSCTTFNDRNKLAKSHPKFLRAAIRFLTRKQTIAEHAAMVKDLCNCHCDLENPAMFMQHLGGKQNRYASNDNERLLQAVFNIGTWICAVLQGTTKSKFKLGHLTKPSAATPWPASPEDLLPYGPASSVEGLQLWAMEPGADGVYLVAAALVEFYQPFAEATFRAPDYVFALERPLQYIEEAMEPYIKNPNDPRAALHLERIRFIHLFLRAHLLHNYSGRFVNMLVYKKKRAYPVMDKLWGLVEGRPPNDDIRSGTALLRDLCKLEFDPRTGEPYLPPGQTMDASDTIPGPSNEVEDALSHMYQVRSGGCLNPTCKSNRNGVTTRLCGRCSIVRYCGEECQKAAWNHPEYPHKVLCAKIHDLKQQLGLKDWKPVLDQAQTSGEGSEPFLKLCRAKRVDLAAVQEIADTLQSLRDPILGNTGQGMRTSEVASHRSSVSI